MFKKLVLLFVSASLPAYAETEKLTQWQQVEKKIRYLSVSELMTPAVGSNSPYIPKSSGEAGNPTNISGFHWVDYEFASHVHSFLWQRTVLNLASSPTHSGAELRLLDPRLGVRRSRIFNHPQITTNYDFFIQPGITSASGRIGRLFDVGIRTNTGYAIPHSAWTIGMITEVTRGIFQNNQTQPNLTGFLNPFLSYNFTPTFSYMQWITTPFSQKPQGSLAWDSPFIQNGLTYIVSKGIWIHAYLNNYLNAPPTLANTWCSLWVAFYKF